MKKTLYLTLLILIAFALRLFKLDVQSLWYDEGVTWYLTQFTLPELIRWTAADIQPPLYYLIVWATTHLWGESEFTLRFPSVVFGVLSIPLLWQLSHILNPNRRSTVNGQRSVNHLTALLASSFISFAPVIVYYSQEARMYTLLVFQACLSSYIILRIANNPKKHFLTIAYILIASSALYTHYFTAFLILTHFIYLFTQHKLTYFKHYLKLFGGVAFLFAPWLTILLARLGDDPSYWHGTLKLNEIVQDIFISFTVGGKREMILEKQGLPLASIFGLLFFLCLITLLYNHYLAPLLNKRNTFTIHHLSLFTLLWFILPITFILLLSYQTPKFNPRYTLLAWPAFALILAGGLAYLWQNVSSRQWLLFIRRTLVILSLIFIIASWLFSLRNWFSIQPPYDQFSKDDFKHTAQFIKERFTPGDTVLLSSGHFFPVWQYYFGTENWTPVPKMETLNVDQVTDFESIPILETALKDKTGVWLVNWQHEVVDPNGVVPLLLDVVGTRLEDEFHAGDFWGVELTYWQLPQSISFPQSYPVDIQANYNFGNLVKLHGLLQLNGNDNEVILFWEALQPLAEDYLVSIRLLDEEKVLWSEGIKIARPANYLYPTPRWDVGKIIPGKQTLPWLTGTPPGQYWLEVGFLTQNGQGIDILDDNGNPQRRTVLIGPVQIVNKPIDGPIVEAIKPIKVGQFDLLNSKFEVAEAETGSRVIFDALWQITDRQPRSNFITLASWKDTQDQNYLLTPPIQLFKQYLVDITAYPVGTVIRTRHKLATPFQANPGQITLQATVNPSTKISIATLTLLPTERNFVPPNHLDIVSEANFANQAILLGGNISQKSILPGQSITITLYWQAKAPFAIDYTVFVHLLGSDGLPVANADHSPPRPTTNWIEGEIIADEITLTIPPDLPSAEYPLEVGLYNANDPTFSRLTVIDSPTNYIIFTNLIITKP